MFKLIRRVFGLGTGMKQAEELYGSVVAQARQPVFYAKTGVSDSVDGRFDMITLHLFILMDRFPLGERTHETLQAVLEEFFVDMDRSLREIGVGDQSLPKKVHKMIDALYGRMESYAKALEVPGMEADLQDALRRNIYRGEPVPEPALEALTHYVHQARLELGKQSTDDILSGKVHFPDPAESPLIARLET